MFLNFPADVSMTSRMCNPGVVKAHDLKPCPKQLPTCNLEHVMLNGVVGLIQNELVYNGPVKCIPYTPSTHTFILHKQ